MYALKEEAIALYVWDYVNPDRAKEIGERPMPREGIATNNLKDACKQ